METPNFVTALPQGYVQVYNFNMKESSNAVIFTLASLVITAVIIIIGLVFGNLVWIGYTNMFITCMVVLICIIAYVIAHELVHGAAYKILTGQKLTFGINWLVAYCGVPEIFVSRKTALIALLAPFVIFGVLFSVLAVWMFFVEKIVYIAAIVLLGVHLGGCVGDVFMTALLLIKFRDKNLLLRDTGAEQSLYLPAKVQ